MNILAVETSSTVCSVAISTNGELASLAESHIPNAHDTMLVSLVQHVLFQAKLDVAQLETVAFSAGPGSFTGLRIGASFVKGLCNTHSPRLMVIPTIDAIVAASIEVALRARCSGILGVIPSHRDLFYTQEFSFVQGEVQPCHELALLPKQNVQRMVREDTLVVGPGALLIDQNAVSGLARLSSRFVVKAALQKIQSGTVNWTAPQAFEPLYHQEFEKRTT